MESSSLPLQSMPFIFNCSPHPSQLLRKKYERKKEREEGRKKEGKVENEIK